MFTGVQHVLHDVGLVFGFIAHGISTIFSFMLTPFSAAAEFARGFFDTAFGSAPEEQVAGIEIASAAEEILSEVPFLGVLQTIAGLSIIFLLGIGVVKSIQKL